MDKNKAGNQLQLSYGHDHLQVPTPQLCFSTHWNPFSLTLCICVCLSFWVSFSKLVRVIHQYIYITLHDALDTMSFSTNCNWIEHIDQKATSTKYEKYDLQVNNQNMLLYKLKKIKCARNMIYMITQRHLQNLPANLKMMQGLPLPLYHTSSCSTNWKTLTKKEKPCSTNCSKSITPGA